MINNDVTVYSTEKKDARRILMIFFLHLYNSDTIAMHLPFVIICLAGT
jgi:hypothetical protein